MHVSRRVRISTRLREKASGMKWSNHGVWTVGLLRYRCFMILLLRTASHCRFEAIWSSLSPCKPVLGARGPRGQVWTQALCTICQAPQTIPLLGETCGRILPVPWWQRQELPSPRKRPTISLR